MIFASLLASSAGRGGRVVAGSLLALAGMAYLTSWLAVAVVMLGAEIAVGGAINVCVLCPMFGLPFAGQELERGKGSARP